MAENGTQKQSENNQINQQKKRAVKERIAMTIQKTKTVLNQIYLGEETFSRFTTKLINAIKVFIVATRKFLKDGCTTKASSIAYTTIVSLIPTLTVALTTYSMFEQVGNKKEEIFRRITAFMVEHNIRLNIDPIIDTLSSLIDNAGKIGGVGAVIMVISATAVLRTIEQSLNEIWGITKNRPIFLRIVYYWAALTLGPLMLIAGTTVATQLSLAFSSPTYYSAHITENRIWAVGNQAAIDTASSVDKLVHRQFDISNIDFENQKVYRFEPSTHGFVEDEFRMEPLDFKKSVFSDIQFIGKNGWVVGRDGVILSTTNGGSSWLIEKLGSLNFTNIHMLNAKKGFLVTDNGLLLTTEDGAKSWNVKEWGDYSSRWNDIAFQGETGIIVGDKGTILFTKNGGKDWLMAVINEAKRKNRYVNLNSVAFADAANIWIVGDQGMVLASSNKGENWISKHFQENDYFAVHFINRNTGIIAGENGVIVRTEDGGEKWLRKTIAGSTIHHITSAKGIAYIFGENGIAKTSSDIRLWRGREGGSLLISLANFIAPFIIIWVLFLLTYIAFPNTKVPFKPAAIGAAFTSAVWVVFILLFIFYVKYFSGGQIAIYGALAAIPIFLLMIYASSLIVLYGAEVSYTLMHPHTYLKLKKALKGLQEFHVIYGIIILHYIYEKFENGKGASTYSELMKATSHKSDEVDFYLDLFIKEGLLLEKDEGIYFPATSSSKVKISDIIDMIQHVSMEIPPTVPATHPVRKYLQKKIQELDKARAKITGEDTLASIFVR
jgi:membrane protein